tara:strand:- start:6114 stop:6485 length:372 start_codon:yes stop_codon:yes gene_type:complete
MKKIFLISIGWLCVGLAFIGTFVPGIPTTIFLIIALWAFAKSSKKFHTWLLSHKRFGPILQNWETHKVVPRKAKQLMVVLQIIAVIIFHYSIQNMYFTIGLIILLFFVARYVISLPSTIPPQN